MTVGDTGVGVGGGIDDHGAGRVRMRGWGGV